MLTIRAVDDWIAVYNKAGKQVYCGHSISPQDLLTLAGVHFKYEFLDDHEFDTTTIKFPDGSEVFPECLPS